MPLSDGAGDLATRTALEFNAVRAEIAAEVAAIGPRIWRSTDPPPDDTYVWIDLNELEI